jgi:hypothetical protein
MFEYPLGSKKVSTDSPAQVMRMKTPKDVFFSASVSDIPENLKLEDFDFIINEMFINTCTNAMSQNTHYEKPEHQIKL